MRIVVDNCRSRRRRGFRLRPALVLTLPALLLASPPAHANEISVLAGASNSDLPAATSYAWQAMLRYDFLQHFAASLSWMNEGHMGEHKRDGVAAQGWWRIPLLDQRVSLGIGAGVYRYFDTQLMPDQEYRNAHGWAPVYGLTATYYPRGRWFLQAALSHAHPSDQFDATSYLAGVGYRLWKEQPREASAAGSASWGRTTGYEVTPFLGQVVVNAPGNEPGIGGGVEFRMGVERHLDWTVTWLQESVPDVLHRAGIGTQLWLVDQYLGRRLMLGLGAGLYPFVDYEPPRGSDESRALDVAGLVTVTAGYRFPGHWLVRFLWNRVVSSDNRDADMFLLGLGYRWE